jgi:hypothetical protein
MISNEIPEISVQGQIHFMYQISCSRTKALRTIPKASAKLFTDLCVKLLKIINTDLSRNQYSDESVKGIQVFNYLVSLFHSKKSTAEANEILVYLINSNDLVNETIKMIQLTNVQGTLTLKSSKVEMESNIKRSKQDSDVLVPN